MGSKTTVPSISAGADAVADTDYDYYKEHKPIFAFTPTTYIEHLWFAAIPGTDLMGVLYKDTPDGKWRLTYRFRHYHSADAWDGQDTKHVYEIKASGSDADRDKLRDRFDEMIKASREKFDVLGFSSLPVQGGQDKFIAVLSRQPWAHVKASSNPVETVQ